MRIDRKTAIGAGLLASVVLTVAALLQVDSSIWYTWLLLSYVASIWISGPGPLRAVRFIYVPLAVAVLALGVLYVYSAFASFGDLSQCPDKSPEWIRMQREFQKNEATWCIVNSTLILGGALLGAVCWWRPRHAG